MKTWRDSQRKDWRKTAKPLIPSFQQIQDELKSSLTRELKPKSLWKNTMQPEIVQPKDGQSFEFKDHESEIKALIEQSVKQNMPKLPDIKSEIQAALPKVTPQPEQKLVKGDKGKDGNQIYLFDDVKPDPKVGVLNDVGICSKNMTLWKREKTKWVLKGTFKGKDGSGGGSGLVTQDIKDIQALKIYETSVNFSITDEDIILVTGNTPVTITLPPPEFHKRRLTIKNFSTAEVTIVPYLATGTVNGEATIQLRMKRTLGESTDLFAHGGQFWVI